MSNTPKISIVTATLNRKDCLPRCIESVIAQDYPNKEHVIIDGGSNDGAVDVIREYADHYPHIQWISEKDGGLSQAFNKGIARVSGDLVGILNDDDHYLPGAFETVVREAAAHPEAGVFSGDCDQISTDGSLQFTIRAQFTSRRDLIECWRHWGKDLSIPAPSTFIRRTALERVGGFRETDKYAMDYRLWIELTKHSGVRTIDRTLAVYRYDVGTISFTMDRKQKAETLAISRQYWGPITQPLFWSLGASYARHRGQRAAQRLRQMATDRLPKIGIGKDSSGTPQEARLTGTDHAST